MINGGKAFITYKENIRVKLLPATPASPVGITSRHGCSASDLMHVGKRQKRAEVLGLLHSWEKPVRGSSFLLLDAQIELT